MTAIASLVFAKADILLALLLYPLLGWVYWRWLRPHLPAPARFLFYPLLGGQLLLLVAFAATLEQYGSDLRWLWHLDGEWNLVSHFAALQLILVGSLALVAAWPLFPRGASFYWLAVCVSYYLMAGYEYLSVHTEGSTLFLRVVLGGSALGLALATVFWLPRVAGAQARWGRWLVIGFALSVAGAEGLDRYDQLCLPAGLWGATQRCVSLLPLEEMSEQVASLMAVMAALGAAFPIRPGGEWQEVGKRALTVFGLASLVLFALGWRNLPPAQRIFEGYRPTFFAIHHLAHDPLIAGEEASIRVELVARKALTAPIGHVLQLIDPLSGNVWAEENRWAERQRERWPDGEVVAQEIPFMIPEDVPTNRVLLLAYGLWWHDGVNFSPLPLEVGERQAITEALVKIAEVVLPDIENSSMSQAGIAFAPGFRLHVSGLPEHARAGETLSVTFHWQADEVGQEDWQQFLHFTHEESGALWNHDQPPLGARLPTRHWYVGLADQERWQFTLPADLAPGRYQLHTGLYRLSDLQRAPVWDAAGVPWPEAKVALGTIEISAP